MDMAHLTYTRTNLNQEILCERDLTVVMSKHKILCHDRPKSKKRPGSDSSTAKRSATGGSGKAPRR